MELRHLRYFVAVCEALNFTKAAAQLRIAQPALSRQVQDLEDEIGVDLLKRSPRGVTITAEGKLFLEEAREVLRRPRMNPAMSPIDTWRFEKFQKHLASLPRAI